MTPYEILFARHAKNLYKRGMYKGDAPMETRAKNHFRIIKGANMAVTMYSTNILTAYRNGEFTIDLGGWSESSTTKSNINYALGVINQRMSIGTKVIMGVRQTVIRTGTNLYLYYDGIRFNQAGELVTKPQEFEARRINKAESKELAEAVVLSGFKDMYPVLYATSTPPEGGQSMPHRWKDYLQDADYAHNWPEIIEYFKYDMRWNPKAGGRREWHELDNAKACWARMMAKAKQDMYDTIRTEVTVIPV